VGSTSGTSANKGPGEATSRVWLSVLGDVLMDLGDRWSMNSGKLADVVIFPYNHINL